MNKKRRAPLAILIVMMSVVGLSLTKSEGINALKAIEIVQLIALGFAAGAFLVLLIASLRKES